MTTVLKRVTGAAILAACLWWSYRALLDFYHVSPIHWGLLAPYAALGVIPVIIGAIVGGFLVFRGRARKALLLAFSLTALQAAAIISLTPDIRMRYEATVRESLDTLQWSQSRIAAPRTSETPLGE